MAASEQPSNLPLNASMIPAFFRDIRVLQAIGQIIFVIVVIAVISQLAIQINTQLQAKNLSPSFGFLQNVSGFDISEKPDWYTRSSSYGDAFLVGVINTLRVVSVGLVLTTVLGVMVGIFLLSNNWLIRTISQFYVEILRNTPLLVQLYVWYFIVMFSFPQIQQAIAIPAEGVAVISVRLFLYIILYFFVRRSVSRFPVDAPRRVATMYGLAVAVVVTEAAFWLYHSGGALAGMYGRGAVGYLPFLAYLVVSVGLLGAAWFNAPAAWRAYALGALGGQLVAGLLFYFGVTPNASLRTELYPAVYISIRGFVFPEMLVTARFGEWAAFLVFGVALASMMWFYFGRITETTGRTIPRTSFALLTVVAFVVIGWVLVGLQPNPESVPVVQDNQVAMVPLAQAQQQGLLDAQQQVLYSEQPLLINLPKERRNPAGNLTGFDNGTQVSPEFMALLLGLVIYTSAFVAEIVRAGIQAVPRGQIEAARSLGLSTNETLTSVILPQALRVIIPPLGNQYLNLTKNSSLALAIAYSDIVQVMNTSMNQSGQSVTGITLIMISYLIMSLIIAVAMNFLNSRFQLVTR